MTLTLDRSYIATIFATINIFFLLQKYNAYKGKKLLKIGILEMSILNTEVIFILFVFVLVFPKFFSLKTSMKTSSS